MASPDGLQTSDRIFPVPTLRPVPCLAMAALLAVVALACSLSFGSAAINVSDLWRGALVEHDQLARQLLFDLRLPRALNAFAVGALLGTAGVLMQVLLRNPLADPYVLGLSGGAAVAALGAMLLGLAAAWIPAFATLGALLSILTVFVLAHGAGGWTPLRLLLTGVVVAAGTSAIVSLMLALSDEVRLRGMLFWLMGDLALAPQSNVALWVALMAVFGGWLVARHLDVMARGELQAEMLGAPVRALRMAIFATASLLTAIAVTTAGSIGFVGLVTPHIVRLVAGSNHRVVVPGAALLGGSLLMFADLLSRTLLAPRQLPVGALTAIVGVPLFLALMKRRRVVG
jgi:iron complex transport system permease protein